MKRILGIFVPLLIVLTIGIALFFVYSAGRKGLGCDLNNEPAVKIGKEYFQQLITQVEQHKIEHGKYPEKLDDITQNVIGTGNGFPHPNITGATAYFRPDSDYFRIEFSFKNDYVCPFGQKRGCTYRSENKSWNC